MTKKQKKYTFLNKRNDGEYTVIANNEQEALKKIIKCSKLDLQRISKKLINISKNRYELIKTEQEADNHCKNTVKKFTFENIHTGERFEILEENEYDALFYLVFNKLADKDVYDLDFELVGEE